MPRLLYPLFLLCKWHRYLQEFVLPGLPEVVHGGSRSLVIQTWLQCVWYEVILWGTDQSQYRVSWIVGGFLLCQSVNNERSSMHCIHSLCSFECSEIFVSKGETRGGKLSFRLQSFWTAVFVGLNHTHKNGKVEVIHQQSRSGSESHLGGRLYLSWMKETPKKFNSTHDWYQARLRSRSKICFLLVVDDSQWMSTTINQSIRCMSFTSYLSL